MYGKKYFKFVQQSSYDLMLQMFEDVSGDIREHNFKGHSPIVGDQTWCKLCDENFENVSRKNFRQELNAHHLLPKEYETCEGCGFKYQEDYHLTKTKHENMHKEITRWEEIICDEQEEGEEEIIKYNIF